MNWAEIKKSINSDLGTPLNTLISSQATSLTNLINNRPKGYRLKLDTYNSMASFGNQTISFNSSTGGVVVIYAIDYTPNLASFKIDGVTLTFTQYGTSYPLYISAFAVDSKNFVIPFGQSIEIKGQSSGNGFTTNVIMYKYVPIT